MFTDRRFGGNPLAIFPDAGGLSDAAMQSLAAEFNLSETVFVLPPSDPANTARVRIFTPRHELPFAGHPNVGTGWLLAHAHPTLSLLRFEELAGLVELTVERLDDEIASVSVEAPLPLTAARGPDPAALAPCAGLAAADIVAERHPPVLAGVGLPFIIAEVTPGALSRAAPNETAFRVLPPGPWSVPDPSLLIYARPPNGDALHARMFAPLSGIPEDPATGSAAAALAAFLLSLGGAPDAAIDIRQGAELGRPSLIRAAARRAAGGIRATIGGRCVPVLRGEALLED